MTRNYDDLMNYSPLGIDESTIDDRRRSAAASLNVGDGANRVCLRTGDCFDPRRDLRLVASFLFDDII